MSTTTSTPAIRPDSAELTELLDRIRAGAEEREREVTPPFEPIRWLKEAGLGRLRIPVEEGGGGASLRELFATLIALAIYANFFTHHYIGDLRWYLAACALGLYARTTVIFRPFDRDRSMPLLLAFVLIGFFIWLAENVATFFGIWSYPHQIGAWAIVHVGKWSSWSLLVIMTFTIVAGLKHIKQAIHIPD